MCFLPDRSRVKTKELSEVEGAIEKSFSAIAERHPEGLRHPSRDRGDGATFVLELENEEDLDLFRRRAPTEIPARVSGPLVRL